MKRTIILSLVSILLLASCSVPATQAPPAKDETITEAPAMQTTEQPTQTPIPPTATTNSFAFRDDFESSLAEGWQWLGEDPTHWSITAAPGYVRIIAQPSSIDGERVRNYLVYPAPNGNFETSTRMLFTPDKNFEFAGLLVYQAQGNAMVFGRAFSQCDSPVCKGNAIYFDSLDNGAYSGNFVTEVSKDLPTFLRLRRNGINYTGFYSSDGTIWIEIGTNVSNISPVYVGLISFQGFDGEAPADFDYFTLELVP